MFSLFVFCFVCVREGWSREQGAVNHKEDEELLANLSSTGETAGRLERQRPGSLPMAEEFSGEPSGRAWLELGKA